MTTRKSTLQRGVALVLAAGLMMLPGCSVSMSTGADASSVPLASAVQAPAAVPTEYTLEDLKAMNGGALAYTTNKDGYIGFLRGNYYDGVIKSGDDVDEALKGVASLLGAGEADAFVRGACLVDDQNYSYYTYYQWQSDISVNNAIVKVIVDPSGKTVALSSSVVNSAKVKMDELITPEQALETVKTKLSAENPNEEYLYLDQVDKTMIRIEEDVEDDLSDVNAIVYIVYTDNPSVTYADNILPYLAHYVSATGRYLYSLPVSGPSSDDAMEGNDNGRYFEGMTEAEYTGSVTGESGTTYELTLPVMLDESTGTYYLGNAKRKMLMADYWAFRYNDRSVAPLTSQTNDDWDDKALLAYHNYIQAYDYYDAVGWSSCDGRGTPILLLTNYVDEEKTPQDGASYLAGSLSGWQVFCATNAIGNECEPLDVVGHEYTHGVTFASGTSILYENQYGAINESLSDIMGNIMEMLCGRTADTEWQIGETGGSVFRIMTDPHAGNQPAFVGDLYFQPDAPVANAGNDHGGVHINNMLLGGIAPKLQDAGMTLEEERLLWTTFICALTPRTGYAEAALMLPYAADIAGLSAYQDAIAQAISEIGLDNSDPFGTVPAGCAQFALDLPADLQSYDMQVILMSAEGMACVAYPDADNKIRNTVKPGAYLVRINFFDPYEDGAEKPRYRFDGEKWTNEAVDDVPIVLEADKVYNMTADGLTL